MGYVRTLFLFFCYQHVISIQLHWRRTLVHLIFIHLTSPQFPLLKERELEDGSIKNKPFFLICSPLRFNLRLTLLLKDKGWG